MQMGALVSIASDLTNVLRSMAEALAFADNVFAKCESLFALGVFYEHFGLSGACLLLAAQLLLELVLDITKPTDADYERLRTIGPFVTEKLYPFCLLHPGARLKIAMKAALFQVAMLAWWFFGLESRTSRWYHALMALTPAAIFLLRIYLFVLTTGWNHKKESPEPGEDSSTGQDGVGK